ncbi:GAF domain-containing protein [Pseudoalteromonas prydzensis]|uniref:GAF domain-containing protein n=1 Tax=Pseudoalteromonas prydzensis TaxID=182141 RepID=UPI0007E51926|nr:GAF domain-containing protein [Pseudoalteromonas prydzensis]MBE0378167.1 hypothetical protein [Pseudoalteromonas prydzensis ACAM 620]
MENNEFHLAARCFFDRPDHELVSLPSRFIVALSSASTRNEVLQVLARWLVQLFSWDRASVALDLQSGYLSIVSVKGNLAIPSIIPLPVDFTLTGRAFKTKTLITCHQLSASTEQDCRMLHEGGLTTCMDAPIIFNDHCYGTLNVARTQGRFSEQEAIQLFCIASILGLSFSVCDSRST